MARRRYLRGALGALTSISSVKAAANACGSHYFDRDTMRFFSSKVHSVYAIKGREDGACFVTSEKHRDDPRRYSVRKIVGCEIDTVGGFQAYGNVHSARDAAKACARGGLSGARRRR